MDYHLTWYTCCPHWDDVQLPWPRSIPQRSMSHNTFKGLSTHAGVRAITYVCIDGLQSNLVQMLSLLRRCAYIQEYLGYRSNNLYFLFSHSWPVVVYTFSQVHHTSQVERKTKCSQKKQRRGIKPSFGLPCDCYVQSFKVWITMASFNSISPSQSLTTWKYDDQCLWI